MRSLHLFPVSLNHFRRAVTKILTARKWHVSRGLRPLWCAQDTNYIFTSSSFHTVQWRKWSVQKSHMQTFFKSQYVTVNQGYYTIRQVTKHTKHTKQQYKWKALDVCVMVSLNPDSNWLVQVTLLLTSDLYKSKESSGLSNDFMFFLRVVKTHTFPGICDSHHQS